MVIQIDDDEPEIYYLCTDHLNSITGIMNSSGTMLEEYNYGPWGRRRDPSTWSRNNAEIPVFEIRGFTGHEHFDCFSIIHMNGRLFDPENARFLNPDPVIQDLYNLQNFNSYSYCLNNPFKYIDPSGFSYWEDLKDWISGRTNKFPNPFERRDAEYDEMQAREEFYNAINRIVKGGGGGEGASSGGNSDAWALTFAGLGLMSEYGESGANLFQGSNAAIRSAAIRNGIPTDAIDEIMRKTSNFKSISKWAGRGFVAAGVVVSVVDGVQAYNQGDMAGVTMAGMDIVAGLGAAAIGGPVGLILYGGYLLVMHAEHHAPPAFVTDPMSPWNTMPRVDNTFVAPNY